MGEHKYNPVAIAAKNGKLPPKKPGLSMHKRRMLLMAKIEQLTGLSAIRKYFYGRNLKE